MTTPYDWQAACEESQAREKDVRAELGKALGRVAELEAINRLLTDGNEAVGMWLSAAMEDQSVCSGFVDDIRTWFDKQNQVARLISPTKESEAL